MPIDLSRVESIFGEALAKTSPTERETFLADACGAETELRARVEALLTAHAAADEVLKPADSVTRDGFVPITEGPGARIGRYKLLQQIGDGGFGVVFMADQEFPVRRRVALKIIKVGMDTRQVVARFEAERQALAMMDHPAVAKVLDGGETETGRPYFVMELVRGTPITEFCDRNNLSIRERLELFAQVCQAVQHAHQKGLIHRDIKPSNVLVTTTDDRPTPKVIDFGIAKAMQSRLTEKTLFTDFHQWLGTPEYMSPEQTEGGLDVDTRSDVYSLGVLLYELLAGALPFDARELRRKAYAEIQRIIREVEPPAPSTRLSTIKDVLASVASRRQCDPRHLAQMIRGDLDWIVMRCIEKDRKRRYETASALADDLRRYLADQPVEARRPTRAYRAKKFIRRHKAGVLGGGTVVTALVAGIVLASIGFLQARHQARMLRRETANHYQTFAFMINAEARGNSDRAERCAREAMELSKEFWGEDPHYHGHSLHALAFVIAKRKPEEAIALEREAIAILRSQGDISATSGLQYPLDTLAELLARKGEVAEAEALYREALPLWRQEVGSGHVYVANTLDHLAGLLAARGGRGEAIECLRECLAIRRKVQGDNHRATITTVNGLADLLERQGQHSEAAQLRRHLISTRPTTTVAQPVR